MIELYLLVYAVSGTPKVEVFTDQQQACVSYAVYKDSNAHVYKVTNARRNDPVISEGDCKPVQQFIEVKK